MVDQSHKLPVVQQCRLLSLNRSTFYYQPKLVSEVDLRLMRRIDEMHLKRPFYGSRRICDWLQDEGDDVNRKRLMRQMGITALYPKKNTSQPDKRHKVYPYLLKGLKIDRPSQVWATDISYNFDGQGLCVPGGDHGLAQSKSTGLATIEYDGYRILCRCPGRSDRALWQA